MTGTDYIRTYLSQKDHAAPFAVFRILFGLLMAISLIRFAAHGWIKEFYIDPIFFFSYYGFEWVKPIGEFTYLVFLVCFIASLFVMIGYKYRWAIIIFFLSFTWIELMDKTTYLNHYYFISVLSFLMIFIPAHTYFSVDTRRNPKLTSQYIPSWFIDSIKLMLVLVYFYAGFAKLNADWLFQSLPLKIWLPAHANVPLIGTLFTNDWIPYLFSWTGAFFDLSIGFWLWWNRSRPYAYIVAVIFHLLTALLFPIGMFPYIMIGCTLIFFGGKFHQHLLTGVSRVLKTPMDVFDNGKAYVFSNSFSRKGTLGVLGLLFLMQLLMPLRFILYPGNVFWTEEGYRFSWRVMLMEKYGSAQFTVLEPSTGHQIRVSNADFLTPMQIKQMATQPDFILEYSQYLADYYTAQGVQNAEIYVENYVTLNGRRSQLLIDPNVNLADLEKSLNPKSWVLPLNPPME